MELIKTSLIKSRKTIRSFSSQDSRNFYFQEIFGSDKQSKTHLMTVIFFVILSEIARNLAEIITNNGPFQDGEAVFVSLPLFLGLLTFPFLFLKKFENRLSNSILLKFSILLFANLALSISSGASTYYYYKRISVDPPDKNTMYYGTKIFTSGLYWILFVDAMTPFWFLRLFVPLSYFVGLLIGAHELDIDNLSAGWIYFIFSIINILLLCWIKAHFRWKIFSYKTNDHHLTEVHKLILNKVPNPIVVFNDKGDTVYSNPEFNQLTLGNIESFLRRITKLKRRRALREHEEASLHHQDSGVKVDPSFSSDDFKSFHANNNGGMKRAKTIGPFEVIEEAEDLASLLDKVKKLLKEGRMQDQVYLVFDGKLKESLYTPKDSSYEVTLSFISEYQKIIVILKDTTEHARIIALETNNQYKDKLLASVSHELKTPLNSNLFLIEATLNHEDVPQPIKEQFLAPAHRSGKLLFYLIKDILDYSQIAAKKLRLIFEEQNIRDTISSCYHLLELQVNKKGLGFSISMDPEIPMYFLTDHDRVRQIILNLLSNALKFTFEGRIVLKARMLNYAQLKITVEDSGIGIKNDDLKKLFQEFTRIDNTEHGNINAQGVGLGLTIADKIAKRLGPKGRMGGIKVESVYSKGSKFSFTITDRNRERSTSRIGHEEGEGRTAETQRPKENSLQLSKEGSIESLDKFDEGITYDNPTSRYLFQLHNRSSCNDMTSRRQVESREASQIDLIIPVQKKKKRRMLVVDDDPFNILAIESFLRRSNIEIDCAYNGKEAIEKVKKDCQLLKQTSGYDLIFMDCQMPIMDGYQATQILSDMMKKGLIPEIPIIGCTAFEGNQRVQSCYQAGMKDVINKPLSQATLERVLKDYVGYGG